MLNKTYAKHCFHTILYNYNISFNYISILYQVNVDELNNSNNINKRYNISDRAW